MRKKNNTGKKVAAAAAVAAGIGYVGGLITAPRSGKQTRKKIGRTASKSKVKGEKELKKLHSEIKTSLDKVEKQIAKTKGKAGDELKDAVKSGKATQAKLKLLLSALHDGDADDPDLKKMVTEAKKAKSHLGKFIKKPS